MKTITNALWMLAIIALIGCRPNTPDNASKKEQRNDTVSEAERHHKEEGSSLALNNGAKWKADKSTNINVAALQNIINAAKPVSLEEYRSTGAKIREAINKLMKDCRMQGPDHEALHHWLEPLIEAGDKLVESKTADEAARLFSEIKSRTTVYAQYFE